MAYGKYQGRKQPVRLCLRSQIDEPSMSRTGHGYRSFARLKEQPNRVKSRRLLRGRRAEVGAGGLEGHVEPETPEASLVSLPARGVPYIEIQRTSVSRMLPGVFQVPCDRPGFLVDSPLVSLLALFSPRSCPGHHLIAPTCRWHFEHFEGRRLAKKVRRPGRSCSDLPICQELPALEGFLGNMVSSLERVPSAGGWRFFRRRKSCKI